jgi:DNA processing protein
MENFEEKASLCALNRIFGFDPKVALALISHLGSAAEVFRLSPEDIDSLLGPHSKYRDLIVPSAVDQAAEELHRLRSSDILFTGWTESQYPSLLKECPDAPVGLYVRTTTPLENLWKPSPTIAVVGTRDISPYGKEWCEKTVRGLAAGGSRPAIVSGLALGTDFYAHRTAIEEGVPTIGVMATGPEAIYPWRHREFAERLYHTEGCALVTDYPPGTAPLAIHFLRRNRIIAGLSDATILIESKIKGGGMMTSRLAFSYDRDVYALPGRVDDTRSQGCNFLIKSKIAEPLTSVSELLESLGMETGTKDKKMSDKEMIARKYGSDTEFTAQAIAAVSLIRHERGITLEELAEKLTVSYSKVAQLTGALEMDGFICVDLLQRCSIGKNIQ